MLQAEFSEINLAAYSDSGTVVDIQVSRGGTKVVRCVLTYTYILSYYTVKQLVSSGRVSSRDATFV